MNEFSTILFHAALAFVLAVFGGLISTLFTLSHQRLCALISLAAGTLLGVTLFGILPESWESTLWWELVLALLSGYALFFIISKYVHHICPACAASHFDEESTHHFKEFALVLVIALGIHSTSDGLALAVGREAHMEGSRNVRTCRY